MAPRQETDALTDATADILAGDRSGSGTRAV